MWGAADGESETRRVQIVTSDAMISSDSLAYESLSLGNIVKLRSAYNWRNRMNLFFPTSNENVPRLKIRQFVAS